MDVIVPILCRRRQATRSALQQVRGEIRREKNTSGNPKRRWQPQKLAQGGLWPFSTWSTYRMWGLQAWHSCEPQASLQHRLPGGELSPPLWPSHQVPGKMGVSRHGALGWGARFSRPALSVPVAWLQ